MPTPPRPAARAPRPLARRRPVPPGRGRRRRPRWAVRLVTAVSVAVLAASGVGHAVMSGLDSGIERVDPFKDMKNRPAAGNGLNILLAGTDGRDTITEEQREAYRLGGKPCHCTDTLMLLHLSADHSRVSVVSLPRDSYAMTPPHTDRTTGEKHRSHPVKLNAAYAEGGPGLTVRTVEKMTEVKIDHYVEVDFTSFMETVDAVGGVEICTVRRLKDSYTGLDLAPGRHRLDGGRALQYVRSRHLDGTGDLSRMQRQQRFLAALTAEVTDSGVLLNPVRFREVTRTVLGSLRADSGFTTERMLDLGQAMRNFSPASAEFTSVPVLEKGREVPEVGTTLVWDPQKAGRIFGALREDRPLAAHDPARRRATVVDVPPERIRVQVENGTPRRGLGAEADRALRDTGFGTSGEAVDAADRATARTTVLYDPRWDRSARTVAAAFPGAELKAVPGQGSTLRVVLGADFTEVTPVRAEDPPEGRAEALRGDEVTCA
ncbi:LCP family glycopolymer transferase [Streptomyces diastaticus]|uniref:LCP family protein n=1 Tax=Streptomyces diastaticus TaxID=1956 RepID=UPI003F4CE070